MKDIHTEYVPERKQAGFTGRHLQKIWVTLMTVAAGIVAGTQIHNPNKRVIEAAAGGFLVLLLWKFSTLAALWMFLLMYPFPFAMSWGTSNEVFIIIIAGVVLIRVATGVLSVTIDRKIRIPLIILVVAYILSLRNVPPGLGKVAMVNTFNFLCAATFMVLITNFVDDEEKLRKTLNIMIVSTALFIGFTIIEMLFPGKVLIPNWLYTVHKRSLVLKGLRMGGPIRDYELAAEFFTLNAFIIFLMYARAKRMLYRAMYGGLLMVDIFMMFTTITRGAFFSLIAGTAYLLFLSRKELNIVRVTYIVGGLVLALVVMEGVVARYTTSGSLFERVVTTTFERGIVPANRVGTWFPAIERGMQKPIFGHGAGWDFSRGLEQGFWPHNLYLYFFNVVGFLGLGAFLFLIFRIVRSTTAGIHASLTDSPLPEAFMKIMHVVLIIFLFDQIKIEFMRNNMYIYYIWFLLGIIIATHNIILKRKAAASGAEPGAA